MYHCIINPAAGRGNGLKLVSVISDFMNSHGIEFETNLTQSSQDAIKLAKKACASKSQGIIGVGGDGTIQEIATGMLEGRDSCDIALGVISCGSGNDLKRSFDLKPGLLVSVLNSLLKGNTQTIDAIRANKMVCLNIANIGLDAQIVRNAQPLKKIFGRSSYVISALISILRHKNIPLTIYIDKEYKLQGYYTLAAACNGQYYGGGIRIAPKASLADGLITLCLISPMHPLKTLTLFPLALIGKHTGLKAVRYIECRKITINSEEILCLDGNLYENDHNINSINFEILPGAIQITS